MTTLDRLVRAARRHLGDDEGLLASAHGRERGGRRRLAVVATDRRVLLVTLRPEPPVVLAYDGLRAELVDGHVLRLGSPDGVHELERVRPDAAALLVDLVSGRTDVASARPPAAPRIRIVS